MHINEAECKDVMHDQALDYRVEPLRHPAELVAAGLASANGLLDDLPAAVTYLPEQGEGSQASKLRDRLLVVGLLSSWKVLRLLRATTTAWFAPTATGFDPFMATTTIRAALEEVARMHLILARVQPLVEKIEAGAPAGGIAAIEELGAVLDRLLSGEDGRGLSKNSGVKESVGRAVASVKMFDLTTEIGEGLYSYLSAVAHAEGPGTALFQSDEYVDGKWLSREPSKHRTRSARVAALAGVTLSGLLLRAHWTALTALVDRLAAVAGTGPRDTSPRLQVPPEDWYEHTGKPPRIWRDGLWTYWEPDLARP